MNRIALALLGLLALPALPAAKDAPPSPGLGAPRGAPLSGLALDAQTDDVGALLRCPVCQGLSVTDSPSTMARNMKAEVREKLAAGYDREQILAHFERSYGEFVRLEPPLRGVNWIVWLAPIAGLLVGAWVVSLALRPRRARPAEPDSGPLVDEPELLPHLLRVREAAYGWPGGVRPEQTQ